MNTAAHSFATPTSRISYNNIGTVTATGHRTSINRTASRPLGNVEADHKLYVSLQLNGNVIAELSLIGVSTLSDIISQLRYLTGKYRGLAQMHIRNITAGWSTRRPLMLYA